MWVPLGSSTACPHHQYDSFSVLPFSILPISCLLISTVHPLRLPIGVRQTPPTREINLCHCLLTYLFRSKVAQFNREIYWIYSSTEKLLLEQKQMSYPTGQQIICHSFFTVSQEGHKSPGYQFSTVFPQPSLSAGYWFFSIHFNPVKTQEKVSIVKSPLPSPTSFPELSCMTDFTAFSCQNSTWEQAEWWGKAPSQNISRF